MITDYDQSGTFSFILDIINNGYHIVNLKKAKLPNFYPNSFPDYPGVQLKELSIGDHITIRAFFLVEPKGQPYRIEGGYIDLEVEQIEPDCIVAGIQTELPQHFPLGVGDAIEILEEEILYKIKQEIH